MTVVCGKPAVLFVDDEEKILRAFRRQLGHKFTVYTACGAEKGLETLGKQSNIAVIVVDYRMPSMNGLEFIAAGRKISSTARWIMLSGYATMDVMLQAQSDPDVFRFLSKPCSTEELEQEIRLALSHGYSENEAEPKQSAFRGK